MNLPDTLNFFCFGAQKSGTTTLHNILAQHPDIFFPEVKEAYFFDDEERFAKGLSWYYSTFFRNYKQEKRVGTITPEYMFIPGAAERIKEEYGNEIKIIFLLRNPVARAFSHYRMSKKRGLESLSFEKALLREKQRITDNPTSRRQFSYVRRGLYFQQLSRILPLFPKKNVKIILFEDDFIKNRYQTIKEILEFLELPFIDLKVNIQANEASKAKIKLLNTLIYSKNKYIKTLKRLIPSELIRKKLAVFLERANSTPIKKSEQSALSEEIKKEVYLTYFKEDINQLEKLIGKDLSDWKYD